ncbi:hypothetical protein PRIPAC_90549 [Pristionchus pacificus]|uniref:ADP ribosylation factor n=1 Tax=Pristionchus pacificus TaxID=54126 RepID=A0A454XS71_PRIPA|nr:hypothetical protein PRIPAC_90549 [Pristionchus pacificus]|eukprot:PDM82234.1 ADP ribosylation factor [Pristionchus pacificus]
MRRQPDLKAKVVFMGNSRVGKTSIIQRHDRREFTAETSATIGANFIHATIVYQEKKKLELEIWDTVGTERYSCMMPCYLRKSHGAFLVFDISNRDSFEAIARWYAELENACDISNLSLVLVGNKTDLAEERKVSEDEARALADEKSMVYVETSALQNRGISEMMRVMADLLIERLEFVFLTYPNREELDTVDVAMPERRHRCKCNEYRGT